MNAKKCKAFGRKLLVGFLSICTIVTYTGNCDMHVIYAEEEIKEEVTYEEIKISTAEDLMELADKCHSDSWSTNKMVTLTQDIDLSGSEFSYIPYFDGFFDGKGHTVSNFKLTENGYEIGFFRYTGENATICNLTVTGSVIVEEEQQCIGGLCGVNKGIIRNCVFQGMVSGKTQTGGIAGMNDITGVIQRCASKGKVSGYYYTGGITGKNLGLIDNCTNYANINDSGEWVEGDDENTLEIIRDISQNSQKLKVQSGVDTGGIAGYSEGQILRCNNQGIVGYERTGYNIGGIVGRQSGMVDYCTNAGMIYGRKDVGGIAGQVEPYIEIDEAESIRVAVNKLHDLLEQTITDMENGGDTIKADIDHIQALSDGVLDTGNQIADGLTDYINNNTDQLNEMGNRIDYVMDELPGVLDKVKDANHTLGKLNGVLDDLRKDLNVQGKISNGAYDETAYQRLTLNPGIGGSLSTNSNSPQEGAVVTLTVTQDNGYALNTLTATDASGNPVSLTQTDEKTYTFLMPQENVLISADFSYTGAYLAASDAGGKLSVTDNQDGTISIKTEAHDGYSLPSTVTIGGNNVTLTSGRATVNKADCPANGQPVIVRADFGNRNISGGSTTNPGDEHKITKAAGTGGTVTTTVSTAEAGTTVYVAPIASNGYKLESVVKRTSGGIEELSDPYSFVMPDEDVYVEAVFAPVRLILTSNAGGSASFQEKEDFVTLTVNPNSGYTVSTTPVVKNLNGNDISVSKKSSGTYLYEFALPAVEQPATTQITFTKQKKNDAVDSATDRISENINTLTNLSTQMSDILGRLEDDLTNSDGTLNPDKITDAQTWNDLMDLLDCMTEAGEAASQIVSDLSVIANVYGPYLEEASKGANDDMAKAISIMKDVNDILQNATGKIRSVIDNLDARADIAIEKISGELEANVDLIHDQLKAVSTCMSNLTNHADSYSNKVFDDFHAVNDQINVVFNLFVDDLAADDTSTVYEDISDEELNNATTGVVSNSINKGTVNGDYNVGGVCGSMAIDEEDPEDNAAGTVEKRFGSKYTALCIVKASSNEGYVTARKDGGGGIVGYMRQGIVADSIASGSVESTEGDFVGGICGESLSVIRDCYSLSMISGNKNVGGIAGYGSTITGCYSIATIMEATSRFGAIAGQIEEQDAETENETKRIANNYFVNDTIYGIDNISYAGATEQISYEELLAIDGIPSEFRHLKVTFLIDDIEVGTTELAYGESLAQLEYPQVPTQSGSYEIWPDISDIKMTGNLVVKGEYVDNIATLESDAYVTISEQDKEQKKPLMLAEGTFTHKARLTVTEGEIYPDEEIAGKGEKITYCVSLESNNLSPEDITKLRMYNSKDKVTVWNYTDGTWKELPAEQKGHYLQFSMKGKEGVFCVVEKARDMKKIMMIVLYVTGCALLIWLVGCIIKKRKRKKRNRVEEKNEV